MTGVIRQFETATNEFEVFGEGTAFAFFARERERQGDFRLFVQEVQYVFQDNAAPVPEPMSLLLFAIGATAVSASASRRKRPSAPIAPQRWNIVSSQRSAIASWRTM
jgi:hypothetical protein